jgi:CheY-like chemotaxis protein
MKQLKALNKDSIPPVIVTTANITEELKTTYQQVGFSGYLTKPIDEERVSNLLEYYFKK